MNTTKLSAAVGLAILAVCAIGAGSGLLVLFVGMIASLISEDQQSSVAMGLFMALVIGLLTTLFYNAMPDKTKESSSDEHH